MIDGRATIRASKEDHPMRRQLVAWTAIVLLGSSAATAHAQGYEREPVLVLKDLVGPELIKGPHFTTDPKVPVVGFMAHFTIRSPFGVFEVHGQRMLPVRVNEVEALAALDNVSRSREFTAAAGRAIARPVTSAANMVTRPVETARGIPAGVGRLFGRVRLAGRSIARAATAPGQSGGGRAVGTTRPGGSARSRSPRSASRRSAGGWPSASGSIRTRPIWCSPSDSPTWRGSPSPDARAFRPCSSSWSRTPGP